MRNGAQLTSAPYLNEVLKCVPRALALFDSRDCVPTSGSFDRAYWHYKTITNHSSSVFQQLTLGLSELWAHRDINNPYYRDERLKSASISGLIFWTTLQHPNGSFDEWYVNEQSYCPTAFTTLGMALTFLNISSEMSEVQKQKTVSALLKAAHWLKNRSNPDVMNQNLAAACALEAVFKITGDEQWRNAASEKFEFVRSQQSEEGWLPEYGGCDLGYSTLSLDLLAYAHQLGADSRIQPLYLNLIDFLSKISTGGVLPGRLGSRGTSHVFPFGIEYFSRIHESAKSCALTWRTWHSSGLAPLPSTIDDRYFSYFYFPQFVMAAVHADATLDGPLLEPIPSLDLSLSGFHLRRLGDLVLCWNSKMGAAASVSEKGSNPKYSLGYKLVTKEGLQFISSSFSDSTNVSINDTSASISNVTFKMVKVNPPLKRLMIPFQIFTALLRNQWLASWFQILVKKKMINAQTAFSAHLKRTFEFSDSRITIRDRIELDDPKCSIASILPLVEIGMHSPSAKQDPGGLLFYIGEGSGQATVLNERRAVEFNFSKQTEPKFANERSEEPQQQI